LRKTLRDARRSAATVTETPIRVVTDAEIENAQSGIAFRDVALGAIAAILLGMALLAAKPLLVPIVAAIVVGSLIGPLMDRARQHGVPSSMLSIGITLILAVLCYFIVVSLAGPASEWIARAPEIGSLLQSRLQWLSKLQAAWHEVEGSLKTIGGTAGPEVKVATTFESVIATILATITPALGQVLIFIGALLFFLTGRKGLKQRLTLAFERREQRLKVLKVISDIENSLATYLTTATLINIGMGVVTAFITAGFGIANPVMWGVAAFALNYVPYIGPIFMTVTLLLVGLITFPNFLQAASVPLAYVIAAAIESHFITPSVMGQRLHLNAFLVFLAIAFWTWMWGLAGAFLAVPLLIAGQALFRHVFWDEEEGVLPD
jgi:predicted PurR-regulated permease PerM